MITKELRNAIHKYYDAQNTKVKSMKLVKLNDSDIVVCRIVWDGITYVSLVEYDGHDGKIIPEWHMNGSDRVTELDAAPDEDGKCAEEKLIRKYKEYRNDEGTEKAHPRLLRLSRVKGA